MLVDQEKSRELAESGLFLAPGTTIGGHGRLGFGCHTFYAYDAMPAGLISSSLGMYSGINCALYGCDIGNYCSIGRFSGIGSGHPLTRLTTSPVTYFSPGMQEACYAFSKKESWIDPGGRTHIGHDVWIGMMTAMREGVHIGNGAVIGANSTVTHDVPDFAIVAGSPARIIRMRFADSLIERIQKSQWFLYDWQGIEIEWANPDRALDIMEKYIAEGKAPRGNFFTYQADQTSLAFVPDSAS